MGFLSIEGVAAHFGVSVTTTHRWRRAGLLPAPSHRKGRRHLWPRQVIEQCNRPQGNLPVVAIGKGV